MSQKPNLFSYATSELSQDAFLCWLAAWADPQHQAADGPLHRAGTAFLNRLLEVGNVQRPANYQSIQIQKQWKKIDVLLLVNDDIAILIEDKTETEDPLSKLLGYKDLVRREFPERQIAAVYLKTGDQGSYCDVQQAGYGLFRRRDCLAILEDGERAGVRNHIFVDFHHHLQRLDDRVQRYLTAPLGEWDRYCWIGFFEAIQQQLGEGRWEYVPNPNGGFMGFYWHYVGNRYLELGEERLRFKIMDLEKPQQSQGWDSWHRALMSKNGAGGIRITKPRRQLGRCMAVAVLDGDYRQADDRGQLDFRRTVDKVREAQAFMDAALSGS